VLRASAESPALSLAMGSQNQVSALALSAAADNA
jgi:hypothetical protein